MINSADAPAWLVEPVSDLLQDLWRWPGQSRSLDLYVARATLAAIAQQVVGEPYEVGGYLLGRHYKLVGAGGQEKHGVVVLNFFRVDQAGGGEFSFGAGGRARHLEALAEIPEFEGLAIVGWFHSHLNRGAHLSPAVDVPIHERSFPEPWQVAYVLDMERHEAGFFLWENGEVRGAHGQCLALFEPETLEAATPVRAEPAPKAHAKASRAALGDVGSARDGAIAVIVLLLGLAAFVVAMAHRPFWAWSPPGTQQIRWVNLGPTVTYYALFRSGEPKMAPVQKPFAVVRGTAPTVFDFEGAGKAKLVEADFGKRYYYFIAAYDAGGHATRWSMPVSLVLPRHRVPRAPLASLELSDTRSSVTLKVAPVAIEDGIGYWLLREGPLTSGTMTFLADGKPVSPRSAFTMTDRVKEAGAYRYLAIAQDWSGNVGEPWDSGAVALAASQRGLSGLF